MSTEVQAAPVVAVARDLRAIASLCERLLTEAVHTANDHEIPGGEAMVALGPVADPTRYAANVEAAEWRHLTDPRRWGEATLDLGHEDDDLAPVTQVLWFWSDEIRSRHGYPLEGRRATPASEANVIRLSLDWLWDNEPHFDDLAGDIRGARRRLENILHDGERVVRGAPCMYDECGGVALYRRPYPTRDPATGEKVWALTDWRCPRCARSWDEEGYRRNVSAATEQAKRQDIDGEMWCADDVAAQVVGRSVKTIRTWVDRGELAAVCLLAGRRVGFVRLDEVRLRHEQAKRRVLA